MERFNWSVSLNAVATCVGGEDSGLSDFWLASLPFSHRVLPTCSFTEASPKNQKSSLPHPYIISVNALAANIGRGSVTFL